MRHLIVRVWKLLLRTVILLLAVVSLGVGFCVWLLMTGPVSVPWLTPYIERELSGDRAIVDIEDAQLRLGDDQSLELSATGLRVRDPEGRLLSELPKVEIGLSTTAMLVDGALAVQRIDAAAPRLTLMRREDGSIGFSDRAAADHRDIGASLAAFLAAPRGGADWAHLERIRVTGGELVIEDRALGSALRARDAGLIVTHLDDRMTAELQFRIEQPAQPASVRVLATHRQKQDRIAVEVDFQGLLPAVFAEFTPNLPLAGMRLPLSGKATSAISLDGTLAPPAFDITASAGVIELPELGLAAVPIEAMDVRGALAADLEGVAIERLTITSDGARLSGDGEAGWRGGEPTLHADLEAENVNVDHLERFWPTGEGREARTWVIENLSGGVVPHARAKLCFEAGDFGQKPLPERTLDGEFVFADLSVRYVDTMPPLVGVGGSATFTGQRMEFAVTSGHVDELVVNQGTVVITGIGIKGRDTTQLEIATQVAGPVAQALSLIDQPPLEYARRAGIAPESASGRVVVDLRIGMPLHRDFDPAEVRVAADATITQGALAGEPVSLTDGYLTLTVKDGGMDLVGEAAIESVPVRLRVHEDLGDGGGARRRYQVEGTPDAALLKRLGVELPVTLEGELDVTASVTETPGMHTAEIAVDLTPTVIEVPQLGWQKAAGASGALTATVMIAPEGPVQVTAFRLTSDDLEAEGSLEAQTGPLRLVRLHLDRMRVGEREATVALRADEPAGYEVRINATTLDLSPWLEREEEPETAEPEVPLRLSLQAARLMIDGHALTDVDADVVREPGGWRSAGFTGRLPSGGAVELALVPDGERRKLRLTSTDFGGLLQTLRQTGRIVGGELELEATIFRQEPSLRAEGMLLAHRFDVLDAPILARLLTVASLTGLGNLLGGEGIAFERLETEIAVQDGTVRLKKGRLYGSQLGLTFEGQVDLASETLDLEGTVVPLYGVNWAIGQIPVVGQLLRGSKGEGAFAATYSMRGPVEDASIRVNPLAALTPGFLRELFSGLREGTLEPPEMLPSRDD